MHEFKKYARKVKLSELREPTPEDKGDHEGGSISVSPDDVAEWDGPRNGKVSRNPDKHSDQWYISAGYFAANFEPDPVE